MESKREEQLLACITGHKLRVGSPATAPCHLPGALDSASMDEESPKAALLSLAISATPSKSRDHTTTLHTHKCLQVMAHRGLDFSDDFDKGDLDDSYYSNEEDDDVPMFTLGERRCVWVLVGFFFRGLGVWVPHSSFARITTEKFEWKPTREQGRVTTMAIGNDILLLGCENSTVVR